LDTTQFDSVKDRYFKLLEESPFFDAGQKDRLGRFIADTPYSDTAIHGDLQYSNAIFVGDERYFIDLGDFCYGNKLFDLGMVYLCCVLSSDEFVLETFHMSKPLSTQFWHHFVKAYFGEGIPVKEVEEMLSPYAGLKTLIIERDTGEPQPLFRAALKSVL
jgi:uncharacterized protein (TIGR02172 family)